MNIDTSERGCLKSVALEDHAVRDHNEEINLLNLKKLGLAVEILRLSNSEIALQRSNLYRAGPQMSTSTCRTIGLGIDGDQINARRC